ncbi:MAG: TetR/AcrR family transcriptional regulator [Pseudomonadota bacterium]
MSKVAADQAGEALAEKPRKSRTKASTAGKASAKAIASKQARGAGRPRSEACHSAILDAASLLLDTEPYHKISIERIAEMAKCGKPTIYRWWPSKADLILEAYRAEGMRRVPPTEPSDDAFADLEDFLKRLLRAHRNRTASRGLRALIAESQFDPEFRQKFYSVFLEMRRDMMRAILRSGIEKGQFRKDLDEEAAVDLLFGGFWYRLLSGTSSPLNDAYAEAMVALVKPSLAANPVN